MPKREVVVVLRADDAAARQFSVEAPTATPAGKSLAQVLQSFNATMRPMFELGASARAAEAPITAEESAVASEMSRYYSVDVNDADAEKLAGELKRSNIVETVYVKPATELPIAPFAEIGRGNPAQRFPIVAALNGGMRRAQQVESGVLASAPAVAPTPSIPDFKSRQAYLGAAPVGVDAVFAWTKSGGKGANVRIIDIEGDWRFSHVDLRTNIGGLVGGTSYNDVEWRNHGTAVLGEIGGDENAFGIIGIAPDAQVSCVSHGDIGSARAIHLAAGLLRAGDVLLLEMHRAGPRFDYASRDDQRGYIAVEWWPDDLLAIQFASARGITVVEAAGNGAENLDDPLYDQPGSDFPAQWKNPFRGAQDSSAIVVGAGAPPTGTHGRDHGPDRSRLDFSNFGSRIDCQGWGREVTTTGYGDLFGAQLDEDFWFTDIFSGTSSASPIVTGVVAALQGIAKSSGSPLAPKQMRGLLRAYGSPQTDAPGRPATQRIGSRPDLRKLVAAMQAIA
jgi:subtilisin family serine protease